MSADRQTDFCDRSMDDQLRPPNGAVDHKPTEEDQPTLDQGLIRLDGQALVENADATLRNGIGPC
jgi:hypothetical protein